jgi:cell division septation protein DedD
MMTQDTEAPTVAKPATAKKAKPRAARKSPTNRPVATQKPFTVPVEYLIDYGDAKKGAIGKLEVSEARRLGWRGIVRETNADKK